MVAQTNLPAKQIQDSAARTKLFFDTYGKAPLEFPATDVDATVGFFTSRGFADDSAQTVALTLLKLAIPNSFIGQRYKNGKNELNFSCHPSSSCG